MTSTSLDGHVQIVRYTLPPHSWSTEHTGDDAQIVFLHAHAVFDGVVYAGRHTP